MLNSGPGDMSYVLIITEEEHEEEEEEPEEEPEEEDEEEQEEEEKEPRAGPSNKKKDISVQKQKGSSQKTKNG
jgi:hypothetical protein